MLLHFSHLAVSYALLDKGFDVSLHVPKDKGLLYG